MRFRVDDADRDSVAQTSDGTADRVAPPVVTWELRRELLQPFRPGVEHAERERLVDRRREIQLQLSVPGHEFLPRRRPTAGVQPRTQAAAGVAREQARTLERDHLRQDAGPPPGERRSQRRLERERGWILLEPCRAVRRRDADDRRPGSCEHELGLTRPRYVPVDPCGRAIEPARLVPGELRRSAYSFSPNIQRWLSSSV